MANIPLSLPVHGMAPRSTKPAISTSLKTFKQKLQDAFASTYQHKTALYGDVISQQENIGKLFGFASSIGSDNLSIPSNPIVIPYQSSGGNSGMSKMGMVVVLGVIGIGAWYWYKHRK